MVPFYRANMRQDTHPQSPMLEGPLRHPAVLLGFLLLVFILLLRGTAGFELLIAEVRQSHSKRRQMQ